MNAQRSNARSKTLRILILMLLLAYGLGAFTVWAVGNIDITVR